MKAIRFGLAVAAGLWVAAASAQDPLVTLPKNYQLTFENAEVRVIRAHYGAREKIPVHDHTAFATVFVYLSDSGQVRIDHVDADGKVEPVVRPPTVKGAYRVADGIAERHSIENLGDTDSDFLRVELKHVSLASLKEPYRGRVPANLTGSADVVEFDHPALQVERIVCAGSAACEVQASKAPSLLVAFGPVELTVGSTKAVQLGTGAVWWVSASQSASVMPGAGAPGHLLRILLPKVQ